MKFFLEERALKEACGILRTLDRPSAVSVRAEQGGVVFRAFDGFKYLSVSTGADVHEEGEAAFPSGYLNLISLEGKPCFTAKDGRLFVRTASGSSAVPLTTDSTSFPESAPLGTVTVGLDAVQGLIERTLYACLLKDWHYDSRFAYGCMLLECDRDYIRSVCTGRHLLATCRMPKGSSYRGRFLLPKQGVAAVRKLKGRWVTITFYEGKVGFSTEGDVSSDITVPEYAGRFPDYQDLIGLNDRHAAVLSGERQELLSALSAIMELGEDTAVSITLAYDADYVKKSPRLFGRDDHGGYVERRPALTFEGGDVTAKVVAGNLYKAVYHSAAHNSEGTVRVFFRGDNLPLVVKGDGDDYVAVVNRFVSGETR